MAKVSTSITLDSNLKKASQELFSQLGMDFSTAITIFLKQAIKSHGLPFAVTTNVPNNETVEAINEYYEMLSNPKKYKRYASAKEAFDEVLKDAWCSSF